MSNENEGGIRTFTAGEALEANRRVKLSSGTAVYADAGDDHIGVTVDPASSGALVAVKLKNFPGTRKMVCAAAVTSGAVVYAADDGKINDAYSGTGHRVGIALETGDGDGSKIEVLPEDRSTSGGETELLANAIVQSDAGGTSSASEFTFSNGSVTIPAGEMREGDIYRVKAQGILPATNGADTFTGRLYVGTELIASTPAPDAVNGDIFCIEADIVVRVAGSSGKLKAMGRAYNDAAAAGLDVPFTLAEATEDISGAIAIALKGIFSASSAGNEARLHQFSVERIRK